jgi:hypothetical protein
MAEMLDANHRIMRASTMNRVVWAAIGIASTAMLTSCESRVAQCQKIIQVHNATFFGSQNLTQAGRQSDLNTLKQTAAYFTDAAQQMTAVEVSDGKLKDYRNRFAAMYQTAGASTNLAIAKIAAKDRAQANAEAKKVSDAIAPERELVPELNQYCSSQ